MLKIVLQRIPRDHLAVHVLALLHIESRKPLESQIDVPHSVLRLERHVRLLDGERTVPGAKLIVDVDVRLSGCHQILHNLPEARKLVVLSGLLVLVHATLAAKPEYLLAVKRHIDVRPQSPVGRQQDSPVPQCPVLDIVRPHPFIHVRQRLVPNPSEIRLEL